MFLCCFGWTRFSCLFLCTRAHKGRLSAEKEANNNMKQEINPIRYSVITEKNKREIVMLRGNGCTWRRCRFCDYHLDSSKDTAANFILNKQVLAQITGQYHRLEVINSGSFVDLDTRTLNLIEETCLNKGISRLHFECHWLHRNAISKYRKRFEEKGILLKLKTGVETFDSLFRESYLDKGIDTDNPKEIARYFDEVCLLQGIPGQTAKSMEQDIEIGLAYFERVCINIMNENSCPVKPDPSVIAVFCNELYPKYIRNPRVDILLNNTDFGIGGGENCDA